MKYPFFKFLIALALLTLTVQADTYVLKNGSKVEGHLLRETETTYVLEVQIASTIKEERKIPKKDVVRVIKPDKGLLEYQQLRELVPAPDGLPAAEYERRIERCTEFIEEHSSNSKVRRVMDMRVELREELKLIEEGAVKIAGVLYSSAEIRENRYELDARIEARKIKELVANGQHLNALQAYAEFQKEYQPTKVNRDLLPLIQQLIQAHTAKAQALRDSLEVRIDEREKGLERMTVTDQRDSRRAIEEEEQLLQRRYRNEVSSQVGWVTIHPFCKAALDYTLQYSKAEMRKIDTFLSKEFTDGGELYRELYRLKNQDADERAMREKLRTAQRAGIPVRYLEKFGSLTRSR